jgi:small ligand-binding sensory domain FIST
MVRNVQPPGTDDLFGTANLFPRTTGLPMTVWVSSRGNARHDVRVKVNMSRGDRMSPANTAIVGVRPSPRVIAGRLSPDDRPAVFEWLALNTAPLVAYWEGRIDTVELGTGSAIEAVAFEPTGRPRHALAAASRAAMPAMDDHPELVSRTVALADQSDELLRRGGS